MKSDEHDTAYLWDMLQAAREAHGYVARISLERYLKDRSRRRALERTLEILGEAARRVGKSTRARHADIDWRRIIGQRNVLAHEYGEVDDTLLYRTAREHLPELIRLIGKRVSED